MLKRVVGTVPVDENGSVAFEAPAGVPLQFQALDRKRHGGDDHADVHPLAAGRASELCRLPRAPHVQPRDATVAGRRAGVLKLEPPAGPQYPGGLSFAKTVQPVLDRYCIDCHGLKETAGEIDLLGTIDATEENVADTFQQLLPSTAYASLTRDGRLVKIAQYGGETWYSQPKDYFAHGGTLAELLLQGHEGVELDPESRQRIIDWLDLNAQFYGTYSWNKDEWRRPDPEGEKALRAYIRQQVRRRVGRATVCGAGQRGVAGREPYPESAAGAGGRRLGTDRAGRLEEHRRAGLPGRCASSCRRPSSRCPTTTLPAPAAATKTACA